MYTEHDELMMAPLAVKGKGGGELTLDISNTGGPYIIALTDLEYGIPILHQETSTIRQVDGVLEIEGDADSVRTVRLPDGTTEQITVNSAIPIRANQPDPPWEEALRRRQYERRMEDLVKRLEHLRFVWLNLGQSAPLRRKALEKPAKGGYDKATT